METNKNLELYFLRHGETEASADGQFCGALEPELTPLGRQMAQDFAEAYKDVAWDAIYCSPQRRAVATAQPLCDAAKLAMQLKDGLKEITYGAWEGKSPAEVDRDFHDDYVRWISDPGWNAPSGGQRGVDLAGQSAAVLADVIRAKHRGKVLIVSHKATIRIMLCALLGIDVGRFRDRISMPEAALSLVEMTPHGPLLRFLGDRSHVKAR